MLERIKNIWRKITKVTNITGVLCGCLSFFILFYAGIRLIRGQELFAQQMSMGIGYIGTALAIMSFIISYSEDEEHKEILQKLDKVLNHFENKKTEDKKARSTKKEKKPSIKKTPIKPKSKSSIQSSQRI